MSATSHKACLWSLYQAQHGPVDWVLEQFIPDWQQDVLQLPCCFRFRLKRLIALQYDFPETVIQRTQVRGVWRSFVLPMKSLHVATIQLRVISAEWHHVWRLRSNTSNFHKFWSKYDIELFTSKIIAKSAT